MTEWTRLFDTGEVEHVIEHVRGEHHCQQLSGYTPHLHEPLRRIVLAALDEYFAARRGVKPDGTLDLNRVDVEAGYRLYTFVTDLAQRIAESKLFDGDADELQRLWFAFIAQGAAYRIYHDLHKEAADKVKGGKRSGESKRASNVDRDRRIHDASKLGVSQKTISIDENVSQSVVSRTLKNPRP